MKKLGPAQTQYTPEAGTHPKTERVFCGVCNAPMNAEYDVEGPTNYVEAMAQKSHRHDSYECPHLKKDWHIQVVALRKEAKATASARLDFMLNEEALQILRTKKVTKKR